MIHTHSAVGRKQLEGWKPCQSRVLSCSGPLRLPWIDPTKPDEVGGLLIQVGVVSQSGAAGARMSTRGHCSSTHVPLCHLTTDTIPPKTQHTKSKQEYYEVEVELITGRTHQLRATFAAEGAPIVHDTMYVRACVRIVG